MKIPFLDDLTKDKILDAIRGTKQPRVASSRGWRNWHAAAKAAHPVRYWITEVGFRAIRNAIEYIPTKVSNTKHYLLNRYIFPSHTLHADSLKNGRYRDLADKIFPCLFESLVEYVEVDLAMQEWIHVETLVDRVLQLFGKWRRPDLGIKVLKEQIQDISQMSIASTEIFELYMWYKNVYLLREDPADKSGWTDYCKISNELLDFEVTEQSTRILKLYTLYENEYYKEDSEMLARLINVRTFLWT